MLERKKPRVCNMTKYIPFNHCAVRLFCLFLLVFVSPVLNTRAQTTEPSREPVLRIETGMHTASISRIGVDAANRYLVTASHDKTVRVWELPTGRLLRVIRVPIGEGNEGMLYAVAISPDGNTIAAGGWTGYDWENRNSIYLFDRASGRLTRRLGGLPSVALHLVYSPEGRFLAATLGDGAGVRVFSTAPYAPAGEDKDYGGNSHGADFDRAGRLATSSFDGFIRLYATERDGTLRLIAKQSVAGGTRPYGVSFSPDGTRLAVGFQDWSVSALVSVLSARDLSPLYAPDAGGAASGLSDGRGGTLKVRAIMYGDLSRVAWSADGKTLYAGGGYSDVNSEFGANTRKFIRAWADGGRGGYRDIVVEATNHITHIVPLIGGGLVYGVLGPSFGLIDASDRTTFVTEMAVANHRGLGTKLLVSADGAGVQFGYEQNGNSPARFTLADRRLEASSPDGPGWRAPITESASVRLTDLNNDNYGPKLNGTTLSFTKDGGRYALNVKETRHSFAFSPDNEYLLLGTDWNVRVFNRSGLELWRAPAPGAAYGVNISGDGRLALAAYGDGTIRWYRMTDGKELLAFFPHADRKRWVAWTPEGFYDCSPGAENLIGWHINNGKDKEADFYSIDRFFEKFYHPRLLAQVLTAEGVRSPHSGDPVNVSKGLKRPPLVLITSPKRGEVVTGEAIRISVEATDQGGGVEDMRLYQNGKLVSEDTRQFTRDAASKTRAFDVILAPGVNRFHATAFNADRTEAIADELEIELKIAASSNLYILAIGLNEYKNTRYNLNYGRADAQAVADAVEQRGRGIFKRITKRVIFDAEATRTNIQTAFNEIIKVARPQDAFVFYYAGHGVMSESDERDPADFYLVPYEVVRIYGGDGNLTANGLSARNLRELLKNVRAQKQLIILDACESGGALESISMRGASEEKAIMQLARSAGVAVLAAAGQDQVATEFGKLGHGVFTYALLKALSGEADGAPKDGKITIKELEAYINDQVPELTKLYRGKRQDPNSWTRGQDFPIAVMN